MKRLLIAGSSVLASAGAVTGLLLSSAAGPVIMHGAWVMK